MFGGIQGQKVLVLFGAPGVGKGTYAKLLKKDLNLNHISTGDEIRNILKGNVPASFDKSLIAEIKRVVTSGGLINDEVVINILKEKLKEPASKNGVILDGVPRTLRQLELYDKAGLPTHVVVNIFLNQSILIEKLTARRVCDSCGQNFNICNINRDGYEMEPLLPPASGKCERGTCKIVTRADDSAEVITKRMIEYEEKTAPLL